MGECELLTIIVEYHVKCDNHMNFSTFQVKASNEVHGVLFQTLVSSN